MNAEKNCQSCKYYKDGYCNNLELKPYYPQKGCDDFTKRNEPKTELLDKIRAEITDTLYVDSLIFEELIDFRNGKISADDVIEEFNRVTRLEVLQIIDKYAKNEERE